MDDLGDLDDLDDLDIGGGEQAAAAPPGAEPGAEAAGAAEPGAEEQSDAVHFNPLAGVSIEPEPEPEPDAGSVDAPGWGGAGAGAGAGAGGEAVDAAVAAAASMQDSAADEGAESRPEVPMKLGADDGPNPFAAAQQAADMGEKGILFANNIWLLGSLDDQRALQLVYTAARVTTALVTVIFMYVGINTMFTDNPSRGWNFMRSVLSILFLLLVLLAIAYAQFFAYRRHKGHSSKFATQMNLVTVRRAAAERYGRMVFWPVIMASVLLLCWLMFLYFELLPTEERESDVMGGDWAALAPQGWALFRTIVMTLLMTVLVLLLVLISWMSLVTYEAHMKDPVERLAILLLEEQRLARRGQTAVGGEMDSAQQQKAARRPELAQTRAARLVNRGRPPPRTLLDRQMRRVEDWLAGSIRKRNALGWLCKLVEVIMLKNLYQMHRRLEAARLEDDQLCSLSPYVGQPSVTLSTVLFLTANFGYRFCCEDQHHHEVPRVILNQGRGVPGVKSCTAYIKRHSAAGLCEIVQAEARWARSVSTAPYKNFLAWTFCVFYSWLPYTICYDRLHRFGDDFVWDTVGSLGLIPLFIVLGLTTSMYNFLVYHRCAATASAPSDLLL